MQERIIYLISDDAQLATHWAAAGSIRRQSAAALGLLPERSLVVLDTAQEAIHNASEASARVWCERQRVIIASSTPHDDEGLTWLERGAVGYSHAYAAPATLEQVCAVVEAGELWVGRTLMTRLLTSLATRRRQQAGWSEALTEREREVAHRAADGASNLAIATALGITERTVKAHLTAIFDKLGVADRLALALRVHGIH